MVLFSPQEIRKGNLVCQSRTQKTSWSTALILNTLSRVTELKEITESFSCEFWHDSQQTFPPLNSQKRWIIKGRLYVGPRACQAVPGEVVGVSASLAQLWPYVRAVSGSCFSPKPSCFQGAPVPPCLGLLLLSLSPVLLKPTQPFWLDPAPSPPLTAPPLFAAVLGILHLHPLSLTPQTQDQPGSFPASVQSGDWHRPWEGGVPKASASFLLYNRTKGCEPWFGFFFSSLESVVMKGLCQGWDGHWPALEIHCQVAEL